MSANRRRGRRGGTGKGRPAQRHAELHNGRAAAKHAPILAAIDLGTNNCRLLIAAPTGGENFRVIDSFSRIVRLGEGVEKSGELSASAIERTVAALSVCAARIRKNGVSRIRAIATHACRNAKNAGELVARVASETGLALEIVTAEEEARLAAVGCAPLVGDRHEGALVFDVGGGSTEVIWMHRRNGEIETRIAASLPVGVVALAERHGGPQTRLLFDEMKADMHALFAPLRERMTEFDSATHHLLGTSGTVTTLAGIALGLDRYIRARVDASWHDCAEMLGVVDRIVALDHDGRAAMGCVGPDRADLIVPGCAIFAAIHALWNCRELRVADRGLREGILRELAAEAVA